MIIPASPGSSIQSELHEKKERKIVYRTLGKTGIFNAEFNHESYMESVDARPGSYV